MSRMLGIAINTFREAMRDKLLYAIFFFACLLILFAWTLGQLSMHEEVRITRDMGLGGISLFGVVLAIFVGVNLVYKEIERKTVYALIPKPIHRWQFVIGKYLGMELTLAVQVILMTTVLFSALLLEGATPDGILVRAILLVFLQVTVVTAVAVFFSTFSTPYLSGLFTAGLFIIGRSTPELHGFIQNKLKEAPELARLVIYATQWIPDLHLFFVSGSMVAGRTISIHAGDFVSWSYVAWSTAYGLGYVACVLGLGIAIFSRRDFV